MEGVLEKVMVWFRDYKMPDGKPANKFGYDSKPQNKEASTPSFGSRCCTMNPQDLNFHSHKGTQQLKTLLVSADPLLA